MSAIAPTATPKFIITISGGPHKGAQYKINSSQIYIGRSSENDISLEGDGRCSRKHLMLYFSPQGPVVKNLSQQNRLLVNGMEVTEQHLMPGDLISIGDTEMQFVTEMPKVPSVPEPPGSRTPAVGGTSEFNTSAFYGTGTQDHGISSSRQGGASKKNFYIIVGVVLALFAFLLMSEVQQLKDPGILTDKELSARIEDTIKETNAKRKELRKAGKTGRNYKIAQESYVAGFRDFEKGNYTSAIESFQACLSLFPQHHLCNRYLRLSLRKKQELIQFYMVQGRKYIDANQYRPCLTSFRNVMLLAPVKSSPIYKEARANFDHCRVHLEGRY